MYLTIGNIPRSPVPQPRARAYVPIAYLSEDKNALRTAPPPFSYEMLHSPMAAVLEALMAAENPQGGGDGAVKKVYPILTAYVADYPEQRLAICTLPGSCPLIGRSMA